MEVMIFSSATDKVRDSEQLECYFPSCPLQKFAEMWYQVFLWALFSSIFVHVIAATVAFATLRKHKLGKFFSLLVIFMGVITPITCGAVSSAAIAFIYRSSSLQMTSLHAMFWGAGQTVATEAIFPFLVGRVISTLSLSRDDLKTGMDYSTVRHMNMTIAGLASLKH